MKCERKTVPLFIRRHHLILLVRMKDFEYHYCYDDYHYYYYYYYYYYDYDYYDYYQYYYYLLDRRFTHALNEHSCEGKSDVFVRQEQLHDASNVCDCCGEIICLNVYTVLSE